MSSTPERPLELVLFGATGFTGGLVAEYLARIAGLRWAIAGRDRGKLERLRARLADLGPAGAEVEIAVADVGDPASLRAMAGRARVVSTTVGPFDRYGEPVVEACLEAGTHYADITGEPGFVARVIERYDGPACERGLKIVNCCGFDSVPHDLGALFTVRELGSDEPIHLEGFVEFRGKLSGGTWHSAVEAVSRPRAELSAARRLGPPAKEGRRVRSGERRVRYEKHFGEWVSPMPTIDPKIVLRSARELADYGPDFRYGHFLRVGPLWKLAGGASAIGSLFLLAQFPPTRRWLLGLRKPGEGPSAEEREEGRFSVTFIGRSPSRRAVIEVSGGDPGYGDTAKMAAESALCLARDPLGERAGVLTPAVAMGEHLVERLRAAGIAFEVVEVSELK